MRYGISYFFIFVSLIFLIGFIVQTDFLDKIDSLIIGGAFDTIALGMFLERGLRERNEAKREDNIQGNDRTEGFR